MRKNLGNLFHLATKKIWRDINLGNIQEEIHIYRGNKKYLQKLLYFFGLFFTEIKTDNKGYYLSIPFDLDYIITVAIKIRQWQDKHFRGKISII